MSQPANVVVAQSGGPTPVINNSLRGLLEATALGAAKLAGLAVGIWEENEWEDDSPYFDKIFEPAMDDQTREAKYTKWQSALSRARRWAQED